MNIYDNVFSKEENLRLYNLMLYKHKFYYGEDDGEGYPPTGMIDDIDPKNNQLYNIFYAATVRNYSLVRDLTLYRAYINLFLPNERPYFHDDGNVVTCLFYINPEYDVNEGGETQFLIDDSIVGVKAKPARLVVFDGTIKHRATSFRTHPRITVALKFIPK